MSNNERVNITLTTRILLAESMERVANLLKDPLTLDSKYDESVKTMYEQLSKALETQIAVEQLTK